MGPSIFMSATSTSTPASHGPHPHDRPTLSLANAGNGGSLRKHSLFSFQGTRPPCLAHVPCSTPHGGVLLMHTSS